MTYKQATLCLGAAVIAVLTAQPARAQQPKPSAQEPATNATPGSPSRPAAQPANPADLRVTYPPALDYTTALHLDAGVLKTNLGDVTSFGRSLRLQVAYFHARMHAGGQIYLGLTDFPSDESSTDLRLLDLGIGAFYHQPLGPKLIFTPAMGFHFSNVTYAGVSQTSGGYGSYISGSFEFLLSSQMALRAGVEARYARMRSDNDVDFMLRGGEVFMYGFTVGIARRMGKRSRPVGL